MSDDLPAGVDQGALDAASENVVPQPATVPADSGDAGTAPESQPADEEQRPAGTDESGKQAAPPPKQPKAGKHATAPGGETNGG